MGKVDNQQLPVVQQQQSSGTFLCRRCSVGVYRLINFKCAVILMLSITAFLSALFWVLPFRHRQAVFDANDSIKLSATVQAYFRLQKPVSELVPRIARLEYDLYGEIGVPCSKVAILSMSQEGKSNWSNVVFGFLPDPIDITTNPVFSSLLRSSLIDLFLQQCNLTLTYSLFGFPSSFEIVKFPGGITIIPEQDAFISHIPEGLFHFTLNSSIYDIKENLHELEEQLKLGLHLMPNEVVYIQVTNNRGSTKDPPVTVEASIVSGLGTLPPERLRQLAQIITGPTENLGLNHSVFGKVKEISLSSFLNDSLHAPNPIPSPSPAPSPEQIYDTGPSLAPSSPASSPNFDHSIPPIPNCYASAPSDASHPFPPSSQNLPPYTLSPRVDSPESSETHGSPHLGFTNPPKPSPTSYPRKMSPPISAPASTESPLSGSTPKISPSLTPLPGDPYGTRGLVERSRKYLVSPPHVLSSFPSSWSCTLRIRWFNLIRLAAFLLIIGVS